MSQAGIDLGGYRIDREVGRGGHARVYRAHHHGDSDMPVALKVLNEAHRTDVEQDRLNREFEFARTLTHPNIVTVYRHGPYWLAMRYLDGGKVTSLRTLEDRLAALTQVADALDYAHRRGVIHSDVKPDNILLSADPHGTSAVLTDFGAAHAVVDDVWNRSRDNRRPEVSLPYTAPEILQGRSGSAASDEYALACTAFELIDGTPPFPAHSAAELVDAHLRELPPPLNAALGLGSRAADVVMQRAMAKLPARRYESCGEFVEQLSRALTPPPDSFDDSET